LRVKDPKTFWDRIKEVAKWKAKKNTLPKSVIDVSGMEVHDVHQQLGVWRECWRLLGLENMSDGKFDNAFAMRVSKEVKNIAREEKESDRRTNVDDEMLWMNRPILIREIKAAIDKLKKGKAAGIDNIVTEICKYGGDRFLYCLSCFFQLVWEKEEIPDDWNRAIVVPIFKKGDNRNPFDYRGISLLSVIGKLFAAVLNERMMKWCEDNDLLTDEQGGFRKGRGCPDQIFALSELLNVRKGRKTFCCFIDIKKAYDTVFRDGLWLKLHELGVSGKMWRMVKKMYEKVESCVLVNGKQSEWFDVEVGVRQGCVLSPILFSLFIDGIAKELKKNGFGIQLEEGDDDKLGLLMYADDIVLIANDKEELQRMIDLVADYSRLWRFELNREKTQVVVFGRNKVVPGEKFWLKHTVGSDVSSPSSFSSASVSSLFCGDAQSRVAVSVSFSELKVVSQYLYLGVFMQSNGGWNQVKVSLVKKAKRCMAMSWGMGLHVGGLSSKAAVNVWKSLVRSVLEYGAEVLDLGKWEEAERIQIRMGKRILGSFGNLADEVVRGDLGWWSMKARRDLLRLRFWGRLVRMSGERWVRRVYVRSKRQLGVSGKNSWCKVTFQLLEELGLDGLWVSEDIGSTQDWVKCIDVAIGAREQRLWRQQALSKPKLRSYILLKCFLVPEVYVLDGTNCRGSRLLTGLRGGANVLRIETGRHYRPKLPVEDRICWCCGVGVEDERHFMVICPFYDKERLQLFRDIFLVSGERLRLDLIRRPKVLLGDVVKRQRVEVFRCVKVYIKQAMDRRMEFLKAAGLL
jgi:hypothetical protein